MATADNARKVTRAGTAIRAYRCGDASREEALIDLLTDLMHWSQSWGVDFDAALSTATDHYSYEKG